MWAAAAYLLVAYFTLPAFWLLHDRDRAPADFLTSTTDGIPGDPINISLIGSEEDVIRAFAAARWNAADPITLSSSVEIGLDVVLDRRYLDAPVSTLLFDGRRQDLAFEKPSGTSPDKRHHVRLWLDANAGASERPTWFGAASYDRGVGVSHFTGQITHHIAPDLDAERDFVISDLEKAGHVVSTETIDGIGPVENGVNGGGDRYFTDGMILRAVLTPSS